MSERFPPLFLSIPRPAVSWKAHQGYGKRSYNPRWKERNEYTALLKKQIEKIEESAGKLFPASGGVALFVTYVFPYPQSWSKKKLKEAELQEVSHIKRPDLDNLNKFLLDCLKSSLFVDDSQVHSLTCRKEYGPTPVTKIWANLFAP